MDKKGAKGNFGEKYIYYVDYGDGCIHMSKLQNGWA
jgi:hypothetical protein